MGYMVIGIENMRDPDIGYCKFAIYFFSSFLKPSISKTISLDNLKFSHVLRWYLILSIAENWKTIDCVRGQ